MLKKLMELAGGKKGSGKPEAGSKTKKNTAHRILTAEGWKRLMMKKHG